MSNCVIIANKSAMDLQIGGELRSDPNVEKFKQMNDACPAMVATMVEALAINSFVSIGSEVSGALQNTDADGIEKGANDTPVGLDNLRTAAKTEASRNLYSTYLEYTGAQTVYEEVCKSLGMTGSYVHGEYVAKSHRVVAIFHIVQCLTRKLKQGETRGKVAAEAQK